jgi:hypothetical protein
MPGIAVKHEKDRSGIAKGYLLSKISPHAEIGAVIYFGKVKYIVRELKKGMQLFALAEDISKAKK